jgi:hypothetical protein
MARRPKAAAALFVVTFLAGCVALPPASDGPASDAPASGALPSRDVSPVVAPPSASNAPIPDPTAGPSIGPSSSPALPAALRDIAWVRLVPELSAAGDLVAEHLSMGVLGSTASVDQTRGAFGPYATAVAAGPFVAILTPAPGGVGDTTIEIRDARSDATVGTLRRSLLGTVFIDPDRGRVYLAVLHPGGGVDIERVSFDGRSATTLVRLGPTFTPDGIPEDRYGLTLSQSGALVVAACDRVAGCHLWHVAPDRTTPPAPVAFHLSKPGMCWLGAASDTVAVVFDAASCTDDGDAPLPSHAVSIADGAAIALPARRGFSIRRVVTIGGRSVGIVTQPDGSGASTVGTIDLASRHETTLIRNVPFATGSGWPALVPSTAILPGSWILLEPMVPDDATTAPPPAVLLDVATGKSIVLAEGASGWQ